MGSDAYAVCRGWINNEWIPGKLHTADGKSYASFNG